ncbi:MAG: TSUP family transporter [Rhizobiaceae bacterium]
MSDNVVQLLGSPGLVGLVFVIVMFGALVQAGLGMGFGQVVAPLLALIDPHLVPGPVLMIGLVTATLGALREREGIVWGEVGTGVAGRLAGVIAAVAVLAVLPDRKTFMLVFGLLIAASVVMSLAGWKLAFSRRNLLAMSAVSGLTGTVTSIGAPPLAIVYAGREPRAARPTLSAYFALGIVLSLAGLFASGWAGPGDVATALLLVPPMLAGILVARLVQDRFDRRYRPLLLILAGAASVLLIMRGLS